MVLGAGGIWHSLLLLDFDGVVVFLYLDRSILHVVPFNGVGM